MNLKTIKYLSKFIKDIRRLKHVTPYEYVEQLLSDKKNPYEESDIEIFLAFIKHDKFLSKIADGFVKHEKLNHVSKLNLTILIYIIVFELIEDNGEDILNILLEIKNPNTLKLLAYFKEEDNLISVALEGCKIFSNDYVLRHIINPLLTKATLLEDLIAIIQDERKRFSKPATVPQKMQVLERKTKVPEVPANTPDQSTPSLVPPILASKLPKTTYQEGKIIRNQLLQRFEENKLRGLKLLEVAKKMAPRSYEVKKSELQPPKAKMPVFKATKLPLMKNVPLKQNYTTVLREAAFFIKDQEKEIKRIEDIVQGGFDPEKYKRIEIEYRKMKEEEALAEIEKKRLRCLITREEAILAKKNLARFNREKMIQYHVEKQRILEEIEAWRKEEEIKIKEQVDKIHEIEDNAREAGRKLQERRKMIAKLTKYESKKLLEQAYAEKQKELARKAELIKEIKTLNQVRLAHVKEFDPTECPNFGLLSEMSIAELQERLVLMAIKINQELEDKKMKILRDKEKHREFVESAKNFVAQARMSKPKPLSQLPSSTANLEQDPDVVKLKNRLEFVRNLRINT